MGDRDQKDLFAKRFVPAEKGSGKLFDEEPSTPYGYFVPRERRMVMNIRTGGGTLVHEMVHALMKPDFPDVPTWFDEGLASLLEQCRFRPDGTLEGLLEPCVTVVSTGDVLSPLRPVCL